MITRFHVKGYRCLKDVDVALTPLHAIIGPNDTGKSSFLQALKAGIGCVQRSDLPLKFADWLGIDGVHPTNVLGRFRCESARATGQTNLYVGSSLRPEVWSAAGRAPTVPVKVAGRYGDLNDVVVSEFRPVAERIRVAAIPLSDGAPFAFPTDGAGWGGVLDTVRDRHPDAYQRIEQRVRDIFPAVAALRPFNTGGGHKLVGVRLVDGTEVRANEMSEGLLYFIAFATIGELAGSEGPLLWLVEEPENGLHPARIKEVVQILRAMSESGQQVVLATHSPLVVNELQPEEVTIFQRDPVTGTRATRMVDTIDFAERFKDYALGELWVSFLEEHMVREPAHPVAADGG